MPADPVSVAVALADKIDILTGFWAIDEKPTGSKDPYALRRAALGVIRLVLKINSIAAGLCIRQRSIFEIADIEAKMCLPTVDVARNLALWPAASR